MSRSRCTVPMRVLAQAQEDRCTYCEEPFTERNWRRESLRTVLRDPDGSTSSPLNRQVVHSSCAQQLATERRRAYRRANA